MQWLRSYTKGQVVLNKENILAAQDMYAARTRFLRSEVNRVVVQGIQLGDAYEGETMFALDDIEEELDGINECLTLLNYLLYGEQDD